MLRTLVLAAGLVLSAFSLISCSLQPASSVPGILVTAPPSASVYTVGETVVVQSTSTDPAGIVRVALIVDGVTVQESPSPVTAGQTQFSVLQNWLAGQPGQHTIIVRATNAQGTTAESGISITVQAGSAPLPTQTGAPVVTDVPIATAVPFPTSTPDQVVVTATSAAPTGAPACTDSAAFGGDVSVPDGTPFAAGTAFTKTWRLVNNGTCAWENNVLVFVSGVQMAPSAVVPVPNTAVGGSADISVPMIAPAEAGAYKASWRLRNAAGVLFGTAVTVSINVAGPTPAVTNTLAPTAVATVTSSACAGQPNPFTFTASAGTINAGQSVTLNWSAVNNASAVVLNGGSFDNQGVGAPGSLGDVPTATTTYTLTATCANGGGTRTASVTVNVTANGPTPTRTTPPVTCGNPTIASFTASPENIGAGQTTTLSWSGVTGADKVTLTVGNGAAQKVNKSGSRTFTLTETTRFDLDASCASINPPQTVGSEITVNVGPAPCSGAIPDFTFDGTSGTTQHSSIVFIKAGEAVTLEWSEVTGMDQLNLSGGDLNMDVGSPGAQVVNPMSSVNYVLKASCSVTNTVLKRQVQVRIKP